MQGYPGYQWPPFVPPLNGGITKSVQPQPSSKCFNRFHHQPVKSDRHIALESRLKTVESELGEIRSEISEVRSEHGELWKAVQELSSTLANMYVCMAFVAYILETNASTGVGSCSPS